MKQSTAPVPESTASLVALTKCLAHASIASSQPEHESYPGLLCRVAGSTFRQATELRPSQALQQKLSQAIQQWAQNLIEEAESTVKDMLWSNQDHYILSSGVDVFQRLRQLFLALAFDSHWPLPSSSPRSAHGSYTLDVRAPTIGDIVAGCCVAKLQATLTMDREATCRPGCRSRPKCAYLDPQLLAEDVKISSLHLFTIVDGLCSTVEALLPHMSLPEMNTTGLLPVCSLLNADMNGARLPSTLQDALTGCIKLLRRLKQKQRGIFPGFSPDNHHHHHEQAFVDEAEIPDRPSELFTSPTVPSLVERCDSATLLTIRLRIEETRSIVREARPCEHTGAAAAGVRVKRERDNERKRVRDADV